MTKLGRLMPISATREAEPVEHPAAPHGRQRADADADEHGRSSARTARA